MEISGSIISLVDCWDSLFEQYPQAKTSGTVRLVGRIFVIMVLGYKRRAISGQSGTWDSRLLVLQKGRSLHNTCLAGSFFSTGRRTSSHPLRSYGGVFLAIHPITAGYILSKLLQ